MDPQDQMVDFNVGTLLALLQYAGFQIEQCDVVNKPSDVIDAASEITSAIKLEIKCAHLEAVLKKPCSQRLPKVMENTNYADEFKTNYDRTVHTHLRLAITDLQKTAESVEKMPSISQIIKPNATEVKTETTLPENATEQPLPPVDKNLKEPGTDAAAGTSAEPPTSNWDCMLTSPPHSCSSPVQSAATKTRLVGILKELRTLTGTALTELTGTTWLNSTFTKDGDESMALNVRRLSNINRISPLAAELLTGNARSNAFSLPMIDEPIELLPPRTEQPIMVPEAAQQSARKPPSKFALPRRGAASLIRKPGVTNASLTVSRLSRGVVNSKLAGSTSSLTSCTSDESGRQRVDTPRPVNCGKVSNVYLAAITSGGPRAAGNSRQSNVASARSPVVRSASTSGPGSAAAKRNLGLAASEGGSGGERRRSASSRIAMLSRK